MGATGSNGSVNSKSKPEIDTHSINSNNANNPNAFALPSLSAYGLSVGARAHTSHGNNGNGSRKGILSGKSKKLT